MKTIRVLLSTSLISCGLLLSACASGGGGGDTGGGGGGGGSGSGSGGNQVPPGFTIGRAFPASFGNLPTAADTRKFGSANFPATGTRFVPNETIYFLSSQGLSATGARSAALTYTGSGWEVTIPDRGLDATFAAGETIKTISDPQVSGGTVKMLFTYGYLDYIMAGTFGYAVPNGDEGVYGVFLNGYIAPQAAIPFAGTASYSGPGTVEGVLHTVTSNVFETSQVTGDVNLTVDFGLNHLNGTFSNMVVVNSHGTFPFNSVSFSGSLYTPVNGFSGTTAVTSAPGNAYSLGGSATGDVSGYLFGPNGEQAGGLWSLYDGSKSTVGVFSASGSALTPTPPATPPDNIRFILVNAPPNAVAVTSNPPTIGTPEAATAGTAPAARVEATVGGPKFNGGPFYPTVGTVFPLTQSAMRLSSSGAVADSTVNTGGATITIRPTPGVASTSIYLNIPALGIGDQFISFNGRFDQPIANGSVSVTTGIIGSSGLSYTAYGVWYGSASSGAKVDATGFAFGYETAAANMPISGTATYSGTQNVLGNVYVPGKFGQHVPVVQGDASFTANFATGHIDGNFTNMTLYYNENPSDAFAVQSYPWNNVSVSANIAGGTTKFSGSTAVTSTPTGAAAPYGLKPGATGHINGGFYGPGAENLSAVWTLSNGDGSGSAVGGVGAAKQ